ncbi:MAG: molybdopterin-dependent oxidoreductase [Deltaproteobacteria bacterium]|nr:molybdopterin-dependent oxidoreductase [Deltaproteobacteria bacterium]
MTKKAKEGHVETRTLERRTVLEWFGKAAVLGLSSPLLAACLEEEQTQANGASKSRDSAGDTDIEPDSEFAEYPFSPGEGHSLLDQFVVFTVDEQNLADILKNWSLQIDGLVETPVTLTFAQLREMTVTRQVTDFHCVTGWSVHDIPWVGVSLADLLDLVSPKDSATHITFHCQGDIYTESTPIDEALQPKTIMAYGVGDSTLPLDHGFPLRLIIPRKLGYKNAKYIYRIELTDAPHLGYWEQLGYPYDADVPDSRLRKGKY